MKKIVGIFLTMVMLFVIITANAEYHYIWERVWDSWKEDHADVISLCDDYYKGHDQKFIVDNVYYDVGSELGYGEEYKDYTAEEFAKLLEESFHAHGVSEVDISVQQIGMGSICKIMRMEINTETDIREVDDFGYLDYDDGSEVYHCVFIYYEHVY